MSSSCQWRAVTGCDGHRCLMNGSIGAHRAGDKAGVGLVRPSATGSDRGHGSVGGFTPLPLCKHTEPPDWTATPTNQRPPCPLRTTAAGSASARSFIGSSARIFYMNQRASCAFSPCPPPLPAGFVVNCKDVTKSKAASQFDAVQQMFTILQEVRSLGGEMYS